MSDWFYAKPTRLLWVALWVQVIVSGEILALGNIPYLTLAMIPIIGLLIRLKRKGLL